MRPDGRLIALLCLAGVGWGATQPLSKIAVSTGHLPFGLIFWQLVIGAVALGLVQLVRRRPLPLGGPQLRVMLLIALIGTVLPNSASYRAAIHLPSGIISILLSLIPMLAFPIALALGNDRFRWGRLLGLVLGFSAVVLIAAPDAALPDPAMVLFLPIGLIAPLFYAMEGNIVDRWGTASLGPMQLLFGASVIGAVIALPLALSTGQFISPFRPYGAPEWALIAASVIHVIVYTLYVWLVARAGAVFAAQVSYIVTGSGVVWAMLILGERYSGWVWAALALMMAGLALVQPRKTAATGAAQPSLADPRRMAEIEHAEQGEAL